MTNTDTYAQAFTYDSLDRLTSAKASGAAAGYYDETYIYDSTTGNLATRGDTVPTYNPRLSGLAGWWSLNETNGQRYDSQGTSHLGVTGTVGYTTGKKGYAANFNPATPGVLIRADNPQISTGNIDFTLVVNFYLNSATGLSILVNKGQEGNPNVQDYALIQSNNLLVFRVGNGSTNATVVSTAFTAGAWHQVIAWHDSVNNTLNIQIDNGTVNSTSYSGGAMDSTYPLTIGAHWDPAYVFNGRVDEVALYKRVLSANERGWLYNGGLGRTYSELSSPPTVTNPTNYTYGSAIHKHGVTYLSNGNSYQYDANGNQTTRIIGADTFTLSYDAENRLVQVQKNGSTVAQFTFDADGKRVKSVMGVDTTLFVGAHYEIKNGSEITKYYLAGATRVAMRKYTIPQNMTVEYLLSDQLGSTSMTTDANGAKVLELRYKAWGEVRASWTSAPSTTPAYKTPSYTFTGQFSYMDDPTTTGTTEGFGLMFYNARWYDPAIGRFAQADSIVPGRVQGLDRYAYANNSPVVNTDPSGHCIWDLCIMEGIGLVELALVASAFVAMEVAINPEVHDAAVDGITDTINSVDTYISTRQQNLINQHETRVQNANNGGSFPTSGCFSSTRMMVYCAAGGGVILGTVLYAVVKGGCNENESNSKCPTSPTSESASTSTPTPTNTPNLSCAPYIQCPTPSSTPTYIPTPKPTITPKITPTRLPNYLPDTLSCSRNLMCSN